MVSNTVHPKYKLSVVSGGRPQIPRVSNRSSSQKTVTRLTHDRENYIIPFNNQLKIYAIETRQCVKTVKYGNSAVLGEVFGQDDGTSVVHIALGDMSGDAEQDSDKLTLFSSRGHAVVVNYRGKLVEEPKQWTLGVSDGESVLKVFENAQGAVCKVLTIAEGASGTHTYRLYAYQAGKLEQLRVFEEVLLSTWSSNDEHLAVLVRDAEGKKRLVVESLAKDGAQNALPLPASNLAASSNASFVTSMAVDNAGQQIAVGFASGVITLVNVSDGSSRLLKWHIDAVLAMSFSVDDTYLISGGWEKVVSFWQLSTNLQQFLPRLNGVIVDCNALDEKYFSLALQMTENTSNADYQFLILSFTDFNSRLAINGPLPVFHSAVSDVVQPLSALSTKTSISSSKIHSSKKKHLRKLLKGKRQDFTCSFSVNPLTKHLYFPHNSAVQIYDFYKNEQVSYQYISSGINNAMGKVRDELNLQDPVVHRVQFTRDGLWMVTYEVESQPEGLLSSKDVYHILKFWSCDSDGEWQLKTKIINPHGMSVPVTDIVVAPFTVNESQGCITADNNGGLKYWCFDKKENNWCLLKMLLPNFNHFSNNVAVAWSRDGSLLFHAFDDKVSIIDFNAFKVFESAGSRGLSTISLDAPIQYLSFVNDVTLIVVTKITLQFFNLLTGQYTSSFDVCPYVNGIYKSGHLHRLVSCDEKTGRVAFVVNKQEKDSNGNPTLSYSSRVLIFNPDLSERLGTFEHDDYISCISWNNDTDFIFIDINCKLGIVSTTTSSEMMEEVNVDSGLDALAATSTDFEKQLRDLSKHSENTPSPDENEADLRLEFINGQQINRLINMNSFTSMFENIDNIKLDTLFDRVMKVIS
ncbi:AaceriACR162Cp [[Ashbya] aceris (nom. inval.)]|nr:AaceriACR162Cp [[Ashbya] aceris (nom. inval.)]